MSGDRREAQSDQTEDTTGLGKWFWFSAVVVGFVAAALVVVLVSPGGEKSSRAASSSSSGAGQGASASAPVPDGGVTSSSSSQGASWGDHGCNGTSGDARVPTTPPKGVTWQPQGAMSYPTSSELGPKRTQGVVRTCFQHSPSGALMAAANIIVGGSSGPQTSAAVMQQQFTAGAGRDAMIAGLSGSDNKPGDASPAGFQLGACTPERCIVNLFASSGAGSMTVNVPMVWRDGDWKVDGASELQPLIVQALPAGWSQWPTS